MVNTVAEAEEAVRAVPYPPVGVRGVGSALARAGRWNRIPGYLNDANDSYMSLTIQIETAEAVENAWDLAISKAWMLSLLVRRIWRRRWGISASRIIRRSWQLWIA